MRSLSLIILALGAVLASNTQLRTLDRRTSAAPWKVFSTKNGDDAFTAYTKKSENGLAVLKVESVWKGPIRVIKEVFRGGEWVSGGSAEAQVEHFSGGVPGIGMRVSVSKQELAAIDAADVASILRDEAYPAKKHN